VTNPTGGTGAPSQRFAPARFEPQARSGVAEGCSGEPPSDVNSGDMGNRSSSLLRAQSRPERRSDDEDRTRQAGDLASKILQHAAAENRTVAHTCRYFGISRKTYDKWEGRFKSHGTTGLVDRRAHRKDARAQPTRS